MKILSQITIILIKELSIFMFSTRSDGKQLIAKFDLLDQLSVLTVVSKIDLDLFDVVFPP